MTERRISSVELTTESQVGIRLVWVMLLRIGLISLLLGATLFVNYRTPAAFSLPSPQFLLGAIAASYFLTILYSLWYRSGRALLLLAHLQLVVDLVFWSILTYATGGIASGFTFLFHLWVVLVAALLGGRATFAFATGASFVVSGLAFSMAFGLLEPLSDQETYSLSSQEFFYFLGINIVALFVVAFLVNSLVSRLERTGRGLADEKAKSADLSAIHEDIIRSLTVGLVTTDLDGSVLSMNPAGRETIGVADVGIPLGKLHHWIPDVEELLSASRAVRTRGKGTGKRCDGAYFPLEFIVAPLLGASGDRRGSIVVFNDLTDVRKLEDALENTRRLAALGELAASLAHEIRNPLGAISGAFQILKDTTSYKDEDKALVDIIGRELKRMEDLVVDVLDYARPADHTMTSSDLGQTAREIIAVFLHSPDARDRNIELDVDDSKELVVLADAGQIRQVVWNLLRNAAQATELDDTIRLHVKNDGIYVVLEVCDTGTGIAETDKSKIFDPFFSKKERGLGLGLAISKRIVSAHKGRLETFNNSPRGTVFRIELPRSAVNT